MLAIDRILVHRQNSNNQDQTELHRKAAVLEKYLREQNEDVRVSPLNTDGQFRLEWAQPATPPSVQVVIPSKDKAKLLSQCLQSIDQTCRDHKNLFITVVDHASKEAATTTLLEDWKKRLKERFSVLQMGGPFNWSRLNNRAIRMGRTPLVLLLNNDVEALQAGWLESMAAQAIRPTVGAVGALLLYPNHRIQHAGIVLGHGEAGGLAEHAYRGLPSDTLIHRNRTQLLTNWPAVTGACLMVRRTCWKAVGGLDERLPVELNDVAFCLRLMNRGWHNLIEPGARMIHHECQSRDPRNSPSSDAALLKIHKEFSTLIRKSEPWWPSACSRLQTDGRPKELSTYQ